MKRVLAAIAIALLATAAAPAQTSVASTTIVKVRANALKTTSTVSGECWTTSVASPRTDAFRCMAGNAISDPCFVVDAGSVACATDVFDGQGIVMKLAISAWWWTTRRRSGGGLRKRALRPCPGAEWNSGTRGATGFKSSSMPISSSPSTARC